MLKDKYKEITDDFGKIILVDQFTEHANTKELKFQKNIQFAAGSKFLDLATWKKIYSDGRIKMADYLVKKFNIRGNILEIGAGSGWLSSYLSKNSKIQKIYALDFSLVALQKSFPIVANWLHADWNKIIRVQGDFHNLPFKEKSFDFVLCDAALHHSNDPAIILREVKRVLKPNGVFLATSEPVTSKWREKKQKKNFGKYEKKFGVNENIFAPDEWKNFFQKGGLKLEFIPYIFREHASKLTNFIKKYTPLRFFNGYLFFNYIFLSVKEDEDSVISDKKKEC